MSRRAERRECPTTAPAAAARARRLESLNGEWQFAIDDADDGTREGWDREHRRLPSPDSRAVSAREPCVRHRRRPRRPCLVPADLRLDPPPDGRRVILHFDAVDYVADVWVNGIHVARHEGGHVGFAADVTDALAADGKQIIVVRAFDSSSSLEQPRGKQDWEHDPHVIWYRRTTGIWRSVWVEVVPASGSESLVAPAAPPGESGRRAPRPAPRRAMLVAVHPRRRWRCPVVGRLSVATVVRRAISSSTTSDSTPSPSACCGPREPRR